MRLVAPWGNRRERRDLESRSIEMNQHGVDEIVAIDDAREVQHARHCGVSAHGDPATARSTAAMTDAAPMSCMWRHAETAHRSHAHSDAQAACSPHTTRAWR